MVAQGYDDFSAGLKTLSSGEAHETGFVSALRDFGFAADEADALQIATAGITPTAALRLGRRGLDEAVERALFREAVDPFGPGLQVTRDGSFWAKPSIVDRGDIWEAADSRRIGSMRLAPGFPTFDAVSAGRLTAISNKTMDVELDTNRAGGRKAIQLRLESMIDRAADFSVKNHIKRDERISKVQFRRIHLLMPSGRPAPGQAAQIRAAQLYARSRGVTLQIFYGR